MMKDVYKRQIKSIIRNASEEGRCVNEIESEEIANSLKAMLQECDDLENYMVTANQNTIKYESLIMKLNELMNCISEYPWVLDTAIAVSYTHLVLMNRAPTLHRLGIQAFKPKLVEGCLLYTSWGLPADDGNRYLYYQWCGACHRFADCAFPGCVLFHWL